MTTKRLAARRFLLISAACFGLAGVVPYARAQQMRDLLPPRPDYNNRIPLPPPPPPTPPPPSTAIDRVQVRPNFSPPGIEVKIPFNPK